MKKPQAFPFEYKGGGMIFRVYAAPLSKSQSDGTTKTYESYLVEYYEGAERVQKRRSNWEKVEVLIEEVVAARRAQDPERLELTGRDRRLYLAAAEALKEVECEVDHAAREYAAMVKLLVPHKLEAVQAVQIVSEALARLGKVPLSTALDFYMRHGATMTAVKTVPEVVTELVESLSKDGCSRYHVRDMETRLGRFAESFTGQIDQIVEREITDWLQGLKKIIWSMNDGKHRRVEGNEPVSVSRRTRNNYRDAVAELFEFARRRGYVPKDIMTATAEISRLRVVPGKNHIISPEEASRGLRDLSPHLIPYTVIKLFSGLRTEEAFGLTWDELRFKSKAVVIEAKLAKLRQRRVPPILPNLAVWLKPFEGLKGPIVRGYSSPQGVHKAVARDFEKAKVKLGRNTFRNCYISYRVAHPMPAITVAEEAGTSKRMVESNYKELATQDEAKMWFSICPSKSQLSELKKYVQELKVGRDA